MNDVTLARLCQLHHIATTWSDIWGTQHHVSTDTQRALLSGMHVPVDDDATATAAIIRENTRRWQQTLPPVQVVREDESVDVEVRLPWDRIDDNHSYTLDLENGDRHVGTLAPGQIVAEDTIDGVRYGSRLMRVATQHLTPGYHHLTIPSIGVTMNLIVTPKKCYIPPTLSDSGRVWGPSVQLYAVRSRRNWGIGDFTDLRRIIEGFAALGASIIGVSPLHALFPHNPSHASPYSPSSRLFLNVLFIDVEAVPDFFSCSTAQDVVHADAFQRRLAELRAAEFVDYEAVLGVKLSVLEMLYGHFREHHLAQVTERGGAFMRFLADGGTQLARHATYEALQHDLMRNEGAPSGWTSWPPELRDPESPDMTAFATKHKERIEFYAYLQWQAHEQLGAVGRQCLELGFAVGLYQDLSLSVDRDGAEAWGNQALYAEGASIGAPPDDFNPLGQNWGLPPMIPQRLYQSRYGPFIATLRASMRHAGALRIDHVMGLMRLFWIPIGSSGADGAYVHYPFEDMFGVVALESQRNRCLVVGEDLGTVPDEVRESMKRSGVLSYRLLYFERDGEGGFQPPREYAEEALVAVSTHDLPTLVGYWQGEDLRERSELGLLQGEVHDRQTAERARDRARLLTALDREGLLPAGVTTDPSSCPAMTPDLARAIHEYVSRARSHLMMVQLEDIVGQSTQVNLPGTTDERPNWRRRLPLDLESILADDATSALAAALTAVRPRRRAGIE